MGTEKDAANSASIILRGLYNLHPVFVLVYLLIILLVRAADLSILITLYESDNRTLICAAHGLPLPMSNVYVMYIWKASATLIFKTNLFLARSCAIQTNVRRRNSPGAHRHLE